MDKNFGIRVEVNKKGKVEHVYPERGWEGQLNVEVLYTLDAGGCIDRVVAEGDDTDCPFLPGHHRHQYQAMAQISFAAADGGATTSSGKFYDSDEQTPDGRPR